MKRRIAAASAVVLGVAAFALSALPAGAADSASVNLSIAVASPCILVSRDNVQFDPASFSASDQAPSKSLAKFSHQVQNCSGKSEPLFAKATNATGDLGASWLLVHPQTIGVDRYALQLDLQPLSTTDQAVSSGSLLAGEDRPFNLNIWMPTAGSSGAGQTMSMSLVYTATF